MKCVVCKLGETQQGKATLTLEVGDLTLVVKSVLAQVCSNCGEEYIDEEVVSRVLQTAEEEAKSGARVDIREYRAA